MNVAGIVDVIIAVGAAAGLVLLEVAFRRQRRRERAAAREAHPAAISARGAIEDEIPAEYRAWEADDHLDATGAWTAFYPSGSLGPYPEQPGRCGPLCASSLDLRRLHKAIAELLGPPHPGARP